MECLLFCWQVLAVLAFVVLWRIGRSYLKIKDIHQRHIFISGCDSGFGRLLAESLDTKGVTVYAGCFLESSVTELREKCSSRMKPFQVDVTDSKSIRNAAKYIEKDLNGKALWAIVNNAGITGIACPFEWSTKEDVQKVLDVNLLGVYDCTLAFLPLLRRGKEGRVVNIASIYGRVAWMTGGYPLSKFGVEALSDGLSIELRPFNITVHTLEPGFFETNVTNRDRAKSGILESWKRLDPQLREDYGGEEHLQKVSNFVCAYLDRVTTPDVEKVVAGYEHALLSKYPKNRYVIGTDARFFFIPSSWLPFNMQMMLLSILERLGSERRPLPKNAVI